MCERKVPWICSAERSRTELEHELLLEVAGDEVLVEGRGADLASVDREGTRQGRVRDVQAEGVDLEPEERLRPQPDPQKRHLAHLRLERRTRLGLDDDRGRGMHGQEK